MQPEMTDVDLDEQDTEHVSPDDKDLNATAQVTSTERQELPVSEPVAEKPSEESSEEPPEKAAESTEVKKMDDESTEAQKNDESTEAKRTEESKQSEAIAELKSSSSTDELAAKLEDVDLNVEEAESVDVRTVDSPDGTSEQLERSEDASPSEIDEVIEKSVEAGAVLSSDSGEESQQISSRPIDDHPNDERPDDDDNDSLSARPDEVNQSNQSHQSSQSIHENSHNEEEEDEEISTSSNSQPAGGFKVTNLDHLLSATLTDNTLTDEIKLNVLCSKIVALSVDSSVDVQPFADSILRLLIKEDMQKINSPECVQIFFANYIRHLPRKLLAEILSVLIAVFKKSLLNVESAKGILLDCLRLYVEESRCPANQENLIKHFLKEIIGQLCNYSCNVKELKTLIKISEDDPQLLALIRHANLHQRGRPASFFNFSGSRGSVLALSPLHKMPTQNGWTFICWFRIEPNPVNSQPYLYYLRSSKSNVGYSAHFTGNCLVLTSMKVKSKGFQHCIQYEFSPYRWYHCAITYHTATYISKWRTSEIKVYVNGQLTSNNEMAWQVQTQDVFDKCFIGGTSEIMNEAHLFCGQLSAIYMFHEALNPSQICAIHRLGPNYMGQYKYANEMFYFDTMPTVMKKVLYEEKLSSALFSLYTPVAIGGSSNEMNLSQLTEVTDLNLTLFSPQNPTHSVYSPHQKAT